MHPSGSTQVPDPAPQILPKTLRVRMRNAPGARGRPFAGVSLPVKSSSADSTRHNLVARTTLSNEPASIAVV